MSDDLMGISAGAFALRKHINERDLSVNWVEYFEQPTHQQNIDATIASIKQTRPSNKRTIFSVAKVSTVITKATHDSRRVRIIHTPPRDGSNPSHSSIQIPEPYPDEVKERLAIEFFKEFHPS